MTSSAMSDVSDTVVDVLPLVAQQWVSLCEELAPLIRVLYGCAKISKATLQSLSYQTTTRLLCWQETIPDAIKIQPGRPAPPPVLLLQ